jgi:hypothetical protein
VQYKAHGFKIFDSEEIHLSIFQNSTFDDKLVLHVISILQGLGGQELLKVSMANSGGTLSHPWGWSRKKLTLYDS